MRKYVTRDGIKLKIKLTPEDDNTVNVLNNIIPRLSYDEIMDGELENKLKNTTIESIEISSNDDVKKLILSYAMFNAISKAPGL